MSAVMEDATSKKTKRQDSEDAAPAKAANGAHTMTKKARRLQKDDLRADIKDLLFEKKVVEAHDRLKLAMTNNEPMQADLVGFLLHECCTPELAQMALDLFDFGATTRSQGFKAFVEKTAVSVSLRIRLLCVLGRVEEAMALLPEDVEAKSTKRRMFTSIFTACANSGDGNVLLRAFRASAAKEIGNEEYSDIIAALAPFGGVQSEVATEVLTRMADELPLVDVRVATALGTLMARAECGTDRVDVGSNGQCSACGAVIQGFPFPEEFRLGLLRDIEEKLLLRATATNPREKFEAFKATVHQFGPEVRTMIDGANVGFFSLYNWYDSAKRAKLAAAGIPVTPEELNFEVIRERGGGVDVAPSFLLIDTIVRHATANDGHAPKVFLHERHVDPVNPMPPENAEILARWRRENIVVVTPAGINDDFCWLYAAASRCGDGTPQGADPSAPNRYVITNDLMRDHHFGMLSKRLFLRWRSRFRITFNFQQHWRMKQRPTPADNWQVSLAHPAPFSLCVQQDAASGVWHVPYLLDEVPRDAKTSDLTANNETPKALGANSGGIAWLCGAPRQQQKQQ